MTGRIYIDLFTTLDGVAQAPGGPDEDREGGFPYGGWQAPLIDEVVGRTIGEGIAVLDALVLGRKTYDIFASYWPDHTGLGLRRSPGSSTRSRSTSPPRHPLTLDWAGTTQLGEDAVAEVAALRERHERIHVIGSVDFVQTLLAAEAYDELTLWVYPIVLGQGKKVFPDGAAPATLKLLGPRWYRRKAPCCCATGLRVRCDGRHGRRRRGSLTRAAEDGRRQRRKNSFAGRVQSRTSPISTATPDTMPDHTCACWKKITNTAEIRLSTNTTVTTMRALGRPRRRPRLTMIVMIPSTSWTSPYHSASGAMMAANTSRPPAMMLTAPEIQARTATRVTPPGRVPAMAGPL